MHSRGTGVPIFRECIMFLLLSQGPLAPKPQQAANFRSLLELARLSSFRDLPMREP